MLSMKIAGVHVTQCQQPVVAYWGGSAVLCRSCNDKLRWQGGSRSALERAASGALEEEEIRVTVYELGMLHLYKSCPV